MYSEVEAITVTSILIGLSILITLLRLYVRGFVIRNIFWDDAFAIATLVWDHFTATERLLEN